MKFPFRHSNFVKRLIMILVFCLGQTIHAFLGPTSAHPNKTASIKNCVEADFKETLVGDMKKFSLVYISCFQ